MDLGEHPSLESTVWRKDGNVLVVAAHTRFTAPCKPEDTLAFTGSHTPLLLGLGLVLLVPAGSCSAARAGPTTGPLAPRTTRAPEQIPLRGPCRLVLRATRWACSWPRTRCRGPGGRPWPPRRASRAGRRPR